MSKSILIALPLLCATAFASAASFDCNKAATPTEKTICSNEELSKLDSALGKEFAHAVQGDKEKAQFVRSGQKSWITQTSNDCKSDANCLNRAYNDRIAVLQSWNTPETQGTNFALDDIAKHYRFALHLYNQCDPDHTSGYGTCEGPARLTVRSKDDPHFSQTIYLDNIEVNFTANKKPLVNSNRLYDAQGVIDVGDFNFDGREDFAIQVGNNGSYGDPNFDVYLNKGGSFVYSTALSEFTQEKLGLFRVDPVKHELVTFEKSGCCWHQTTRYQMINDEPVEIEHTVEDALSHGMPALLGHSVDDDKLSDDERAFVYTERAVGKTWRVTNIAGPRPDEFCENGLGDVLAANKKEHGEKNVAAIACRPLPNDAKTGIVATAFKTADHQLGIDMFYVNIDNGTVLAKERLANTDDASNDSNDASSQNWFLHVDTARYQITPDIRAVGIRKGYSTDGGDTGFIVLSLAYRRDKQIIPLLDNLTINIADKTNETIRTIDIGKTASHGYADLIVHEVTRQKNDESSDVTHDYTLHFDGKRYVVPEVLKRDK